MSKVVSSARPRLFVLGGGSTILALLVASLAVPVAAQEPAVNPAAAKASTVTVVDDEVGLVPELSTLTSSTYRESDGSMRLESFSEPVNYLSESDEWVPIDNDLVPAPGAAYEVMNAGNSFEAKIPADPSVTPVRFSTDEAWVTMRMHGLGDAPTVEDEEATFEDVEDADEVVYEVTNSGLKENILLQEAPLATASALEYTFDVDASAGIVPVVVGDGSIEFRDAGGKVVVVMPAGSMFDSVTPEPVVSHRVEYSLAASGEGWQVTVVPDLEWLLDPARVYPVTIDPPIAPPAMGASKDCYIRGSSPTYSWCGNGVEYLRVGRNTEPATLRGLLDFDTASIPANADIETARVALHITSSESASNVVGTYALFKAGRVFSGSTATWSNSGASGPWDGGDPGTTAYGEISANGSVTGYRYFVENMEDLVQSWVSSPGTKTGLVLKQSAPVTQNVLAFNSSSSISTNNGKRPTLVVTYTVAPSSPVTSVGPCVEGCTGTQPVINSLVPAFSASSADADTSTLQYTFEIRDGQTQDPVTVGTVANVPSGTTAMWQTPPGELNDSQGQSYQYRVGASDGAHMTWTAWKFFVLRLGDGEVDDWPVAEPAVELPLQAEEPDLAEGIVDLPEASDVPEGDSPPQAPGSGASSLSGTGGWVSVGKTPVQVSRTANAASAPQGTIPESTTAAAAAEGGARVGVTWTPVAPDEADTPVSEYVLKFGAATPLPGQSVAAAQAQTETATSTGLAARIDYAGFASDFGGGWSERLEVTAFPACSLTDPDNPDCTTGVVVPAFNDPVNQKLTFTAGPVSATNASIAAPSEQQGVASCLPDQSGDTADMWSSAGIGAAEPEPIEIDPDDTTDPDELPTLTEEADLPPDGAVDEDLDENNDGVEDVESEAGTAVEQPAVEPEPTTPPAGSTKGYGITDVSSSYCKGIVYRVGASAGGYAESLTASAVNPSGSWQVGEGSGEFSYSYPFDLPAGMGDEQPSLALSYSSGSVDGMSRVESGQGSSSGLGWSMDPGYIARSFAACSTDGNAVKGDLCWKTEGGLVNDLTISVAGHSTRLIRNVRSNEWRMVESLSRFLCKGPVISGGG